MRRSLCGIALLGCLLVSRGPALAAMEFSRDQTTVPVGRNLVTVDSTVKYVGYVPGDTITVMLDYVASCNIVFRGLSRGRLIRREGVGEIGSVAGTPVPGRATNGGMVTFDLTFSALGPSPTGAESGVAGLNLQLGVDRDCDLATGDPDGVDGVTTIPVEISVTTD